jgi:hypothetical protein
MRRAPETVRAAEPRQGHEMGRYRRRRLSSQIFAFQALILALTLLLGCFLAFHGFDRRLDHDSELRAISGSAATLWATASARNSES